MNPLETKRAITAALAGFAAKLLAATATILLEFLAYRSEQSLPLAPHATDTFHATFRKRVATGLQAGRSFKIPDQKDQAYDTTGFELVSPLVTQLPWTHNLLIVSGCRRPEARAFYLRLAVRERWGKRELERQISGCLF